MNGGAIAGRAKPGGVNGNRGTIPDVRALRGFEPTEMEGVPRPLADRRDCNIADERGEVTMVAELRAEAPDCGNLFSVGATPDVERV